MPAPIHLSDALIALPLQYFQMLSQLPKTEEESRNAPTQIRLVAVRILNLSRCILSFRFIQVLVFREVLSESWREVTREELKTTTNYADHTDDNQNRNH